MERTSLRVAAFPAFAPPAFAFAFAPLAFATPARTLAAPSSC